MMNRYFLPLGAAWGLLLAGCLPARAQAPYLVSVYPPAQALGVARSSPVGATFSQPLTGGSAGGLKVFSSQHGGLRGGGTATVAGATLTFSPTAYGFGAGETVQLSITRAVAGAGGQLGQPWVGQFTVETGGTGQGNFGGGSTVPVGSGLQEIATGDLDNDGDLDVVAANYAPAGTVQVLLNNGAGTFSSGPAVPTGVGTRALALADVDNDGDLDLLATVGASNAVAVRLNNGTGTLGGTLSVTIPDSPEDLALADLDGDGDLDLVTVGFNGSASVRLNNGAGLFGGGQRLALATGGYSVALADLDNDGDVDFVAGGVSSLACAIFYNNGSGTFAPGQLVPVANSPNELLLADVDADGYPDLVVVQSTGSIVTIFANSGGGTFNTGVNYPIGPFGTPSGLAVGDVNSDALPDLLVQESSATVAVLLNVGRGIFVAAPSVAVGQVPRRLLLADLDGDRDLDLLTANQTDNTVGAYFNRPLGPLTTTAATAPAALTAYPNPATGRVLLTLPPAAPAAELLDALGRVVRTAPAQAGTATLDVAGLAPGLYVVRAAGQVARLVVE